jgi:hypothetical protein
MPTYIKNDRVKGFIKELFVKYERVYIHDFVEHIKKSFKSVSFRQWSTYISIPIKKWKKMATFLNS